MKIKKGDKVVIITGKNRGQDGVVEKVLPKKERAVVSGMNLAKKHQKPRGAGKTGGIIEMPMPIHISNLMLICPKCSLKTRVGYRIRGDKKERICKKCEQAI